MSATHRQSEFEFVALVALTTSLGALSIDAVLPALPDIGESFGMADGNALQQIVGVLFLGMTIAQLAYGPLSDRYGRRPVLFIGMAIFVLSSLACILADNLAMMLVGRFFQGVGAAALRIAPMSIIRDRYEGAAMARIMSLTMAVFIIVPCVAPMIGQGLLTMAGWQAIFWFMVGITLASSVWVWLRQPESLPVERRSAGGLAPIRDGLLATLSNRTTRTYTIASGLIMGAFMAYVMSAEQIYRDVFDAGDLFSIYFAIGAGFIGIASLANARLVESYSPERVCRMALYGMILSSGLACAISLIASLPLFAFLVLISVVFFCFGLTMGNMNAIALQPLGHVAGLANSAFSFLSGCIAMIIGSAIGAVFNVTVTPLLFGIFATSLLSLLLLTFSDRIPAQMSAKPTVLKGIQNDT
ncbi:Bicyclomycin resistance protein [Pseudovibrio sp. W64]|uniref:multidrug effflux MFS transporter n=1 Tax=Pseudovibrio sp. W64 TaxID=1735583 RepID=UPI0007B21D5B|nr:multidrug effflux MFS transporter [Pseudovibrio sp. W64]KZK87609.1 Bicyclomycin resistance protein [Pseudovibrio sp. W64]